MTPILFFFKQLHVPDEACARRKTLQSYEICFTSTPHPRIAPLPSRPTHPHLADFTLSSREPPAPPRRLRPLHPRTSFSTSQTSPSPPTNLFLHLADFTLSPREPPSTPRRLHPLLPRATFSTSQTSPIHHFNLLSCRTSSSIISRVPMLPPRIPRHSPRITPAQPRPLPNPRHNIRLLLRTIQPTITKESGTLTEGAAHLIKIKVQISEQ